MSGKDTIFIHGLRVKAVIGIYEWERRIQQDIVADIDMSADVRAAEDSDDIADVIDYKAVAKRVQQFIAESKFQLIEALAGHIAQLIINEFGVAHVRVCLTKPGAVRGAKGVGVVVERSK